MKINDYVKNDAPDVRAVTDSIYLLICSNGTKFWTEEEWLQFILKEIPDANSISSIDIILEVQSADTEGQIVLNDWKPRTKQYSSLVNEYKLAVVEYAELTEKFELMLEENAGLNNDKNACEEELQDYYDEGAWDLFCRAISKLFDGSNSGAFPM